MLRRLDLGGGDTPVAVFVPWRGSATFQRLDAFCKGAVEGLADILARGHPLVLAGDGDVGGLLGIHLREEMKIENAIISVDGLELKDFDYIDIGAMLPTSGAVPVVIKSLIFPTSAGTGQEWQAAPRCHRRAGDGRVSADRARIVSMPRYRVTVDTGGTFSDFVYLDEETGEVTIAKVPSTPDDPSRAILAGIETLLAQGVRPADIALLLPRHHGRHQRAARRQGRARPACW